MEGYVCSKEMRTVKKDVRKYTKRKKEELRVKGSQMSKLKEDESVRMEICLERMV